MIITGVFVVLGGMKSVLWTEAMHVPVLLAGSAVLLFVGLGQIGGLDALRRRQSGDASTCGAPLSTTPETQGFPGFLFDPSNTPWLGVLLCFADHRPVVLVHGPIHRAARAHRARTSRKRAAARSSRPI